MMLVTGWMKDCVVSLSVATACATMRSGRTLPILMFLDAEDKECPLIEAAGCVVSGPSTAFYAPFGIAEARH